MTPLDDLPPGQRVLARIDINAPVEDGEVQDSHRFARHAETIQRLLADEHAVALMAHQGRPGRDDHVSLEQHADILSRHVGQDVEHVPDVHGDTAQERLQRLQPGEAILLENARFSGHELADRTPEQHAESGFVRALAPHVDAYVNDAYSAAHRPHASLVGFPPVLDSYAGPVMQEEYEHNSQLQEQLDGTTTMLVGGKKPGDVLHVLQRKIDALDHVLVSGIIGELFLRAEGYDVGYDIGDDTFMHEQWLAHRDAIKQLLADHRETLHLPTDLAYHGDDRERVEVAVEQAAKTDPYWDIGRKTVQAFRTVIEQSDNVFVKGAVGVFEDEKFAYGTRELLAAIARHDCFAVVGGGDTARAVDMYSISHDNIDHVSIAGGAYIRAMTGEDLPAVEALQEHA